MSSAQARQKGAAPSAFAFDRPSLGEGDAKAKAEGAYPICRDGVQTKKNATPVGRVRVSNPVPSTTQESRHASVYQTARE